MDAARVVRTFYLLGGLYTLAASLIWGVNTLFLLDAGLTIGEVFVANALFSVGMTLFEIPTGVVADTVGRRVSYLFSVGLLAVTTVLYLAAWAAGSGVLVFGLVSLLIGLGFTFYSGALEAWMVDALDAVGGGDLDRIFARGQQVTGAAMLVGTVGGGVLGQVGLGWPFVARGVLLLAVLALAGPLMIEQGFTPRQLTLRSFPREMTNQARVALHAGWSLRGLRLLMLASAIGGGFLYWAFYAAQPYFLDLLERDAVWLVALLTAGLSVAMMAGNQAVRWLSRECGRRTTMLLGAVVATALGSVAMGLASTPVTVAVAFLLVGAAWGVFEPVHRSYLHSVTASEHRATVASLDAMISSGGAVGGQLGLGWLSDARSLSAGYLVGGMAMLLALPLLVAVRRAGGPGDRIIGTVPTEASCAAEGLPLVAQVDPRAVAQADPEGATT